MHKHGPQPAAANMRQMVSLILFVKILVLTCTIAQLHMPKHGPQPAAANMRQMVGFDFSNFSSDIHMHKHGPQPCARWRAKTSSYKCAPK